MSSTVIRVPRITGFPIIIAGLISIRSVDIAIPFTDHSSPARVAQSSLATCHSLTLSGFRKRPLPVIFLHRAFFGETALMLRPVIKDAAPGVHLLYQFG